MLVHTVFFWLKRGLDGDQIADFRMGLESLTRIESATKVFIGSPADTPERPVVDTSYHFCLTVILRDRAAHDAYQVHPRHTEFLNKYNSYWKRVKIYDAD